MAKMTEERANDMMNVGYHCSQAVICHVAECMGLDVNQEMRQVAGFGAGCNHGDICGAVSAGILALGKVYGFDQPHSAEQDALLRAKVHELQERFTALHGSLMCRQLLGGYDVSNPTCISNAHTWDNCGKYCEDACAILDELMGDAYLNP